MKRTITGVAAAALGLAVAACGSSGSGSPSAASSGPASQTQQVNAGGEALVNVVALESGTNEHQIAATIQAFYRATWHNQGGAACSLFSPAGASGFLQSARIAFPSSVSSATSCARAMAFFNADLADSVNNLQQAGLHISGNVLDDVGVDHIKVSGSSAIAQAPEGVEELIQPKQVVLVKRGTRWYIEASRKLGQTLPQLLAEAKKRRELIPRSARTGGR
jgi:hypothetical protein